MKKYFLYILLSIMMLTMTTVLTGCGSSKMVSYSVGGQEQSRMSYSVVKQGKQCYIYVSMNSPGQKMSKNPTLMLKTFDGKVIKLKGAITNTDVSGYTGGMTTVGNAVGTGSISSGFGGASYRTQTNARFAVSAKQFALINNGIAKVRLSTFPIMHEKTFKQDKIGKKLYKLYQQANSSF